jgi:hypothetical protein
MRAIIELGYWGSPMKLAALVLAVAAASEELSRAPPASGYCVVYDGPSSSWFPNAQAKRLVAQ